MSRPPHMQQPRSGQQAVVIRSDENILAVYAENGWNLAKKHPKISLTWLAGLLLSIFATGLTPHPDAVRSYEEALQDVSKDVPALTEVRMSAMLFFAHLWQS